MPRLYNIFNGEEFKARLQQSTEARTTLSFYQYWNIEDPQRFRDDLYLRWSQLGVMGRIYVAKEGINGQTSVPTEQFEAFKKDLYAIAFLEGIRLNIAVDDDGKSFFKLKIKVREKIVADGLDRFDPSRLTGFVMDGSPLKSCTSSQAHRAPSKRRLRLRSLLH